MKHWLEYMDQFGEFPSFRTERDKLDAVPVLTKAIEVRGSIFNKLYRRLWPKLPGRLQKRWRKPIDGAKVHCVAVSAFGEAGDTEFRIRLLKSHPDPEVRASAAVALDMYEDFHNEQVSKALADALLNDSSARVRTAIVNNGFPAHGDTFVVPAYIQCLSDSSAEIRTNVALILFRGEFDLRARQTVSNFYMADPNKKKKAIRQLSKALKNENPMIHDAAANWLWIIDGERIPFKLQYQ